MNEIRPPTPLVVVFLFAALCFAQETDQPDENPELLPAIAAALLKMSVAEALSSVNLSGACVADFTNLLEKENFDMSKFMKELPPAVAKTKAQLKSPLPFGKPKDGDKTSVGLTVGCVKALPESPAEITSMLKDISLKMGLDLAVDIAENIVDNSIPANISKESGSGGLFKPITSISLATLGLGAVIYGVVKNSDVSRHVENRNGKAAVDAESSRNISYGIGAALLAGGVVVYLVF